MSETSLKIHPPRPSKLFATTRDRRAEIARLRRLGREGLPADLTVDAFLRRVAAVADDVLAMLEDPSSDPPMTVRTRAKLTRAFVELVAVYAAHSGLTPIRWHRRSRRRST